MLVPNWYRSVPLMLSLALLVPGAFAAAAGAGTVPDYSPPRGAYNAAVTQANINQTICVRGWTKTVRPPRAYTDQLKRQQIAARHLPGPVGSYEEDHLIPLELGGHPTDPNNLWPEPLDQAKRKDTLELGLNRAVCAGRMSLADARHKIADPSLWQ
ncbi:MAG TPA: hypothetical protein VEZ44_00320 [bacterium]|nr:hypothetical protein [bacterium]